MKEHFRTSALDPSGSEPDVTGYWPPCCCVAALVAAALIEFGYRTIDRASLARKLGTRVGPEDENPWHLIVEADPKLRGVSAVDAQTRIPSVLKEFDQHLSFCLVPFRMVTLGLYPELLDEADTKGCVVGVGFNYSSLVGHVGQHLHVSRICRTRDPRQVLLVDDSDGLPARQSKVDWRDLEDAVHLIDDGLWILGPEEAIDSLEFARAVR